MRKERWVRVGLAVCIGWWWQPVVMVADGSSCWWLKVLSLVSLGIWGPLPNKIQRLNTLEYINLSYNFLYGSIPPTFSRMVSLQSVNLDGNFLNGSFPKGVDQL
ncbi:unnamed protein product [Lactuca virosa]|uniref:Leucine-rich repeat-containing N-terminal plant-type domain-containing protein n=1 Tax=Lactuca virosa TaxID=75947 RepID=A0AAU9P4L3_9ASTR|nr:unnamed protein product [Lactuca virosa]